jgi:hypothetical protein
MADQIKTSQSTEVEEVHDQQTTNPSPEVEEEAVEGGWNGSVAGPNNPLESGSSSQ